MFIGGLVSVTFKDKTPEEVIRLCVENGLAAIEWSEKAHVTAGDIDGCRILGEKTRSAGLAVAAYGAYYHCESETDAESDFLQSLESAIAIGAPVVRIWAGKQGSAACGEDYFKLVAKNAALAAGMGEKRGIKVAFEWHRNTLTDTNESAEKVLAMANHPNLGSLWQPTPEIPFEKRADGIKMLGERLSHIHLYSWDDERKRHPFDDEGFFDKWRCYFSAVNKPTDCYSLMEFVMGDTDEQFVHDAAALNRLLVEVNGSK